MIIKLFKYMLLKYITKYLMKNLIIDVNNFNEKYVYFNEPVKNTIIANSTFRRILYSNEFMTLNNLQFLINIRNIKMVKFYQKYKCFINNDDNNIKNLITRLVNIENILLEKINSTSKIPKYSLLEQVRLGFIKCCHDENQKINDNNTTINIHFKISGLWESETEYGVTYKIISYY